MKLIMSFLFILSILNAESIYTLDKSKKVSKKNYLKLKKNSSTCYYKNSNISEANCYLQTGNVIIVFGNELIKSTDLEERYGLTIINRVNKINNTYLYKVMNKEIEIIELVNQINIENKIDARVEWISPRRLY